MAPINTTYGSLTIDRSLPKDIQDLSRKYDKKMVTKVLTEVAKNNPAMYSSVAHALLTVGDEFGTRHGLSFNLEKDFDPSPNRDKVVAEVDRKVKSILSSKLPKDAKLERIGEVVFRGGEQLEKSVIETGAKRDSILYNQFTSGAKGNPLQLRMTTETPLGVVDHKNRPIPVVVKNSFAEGVTPNEMFALSYGARKGQIATKMATADTGYFEKLLTTLNIDTVITSQDCGTHNGTMESVDDPHNVDKYLASAYGPYPRNTVITPDLLMQLKKRKVSSIKVRSTLTCEATGGGVCSKCFGLDENGRVPSIGDNVGVNAAQGMAEPLTQMSMDTKHTGGAIGSASLKKGGFKAAQQILTMPKNFPGGALVSPEDGMVTGIRPAPQGGKYVKINSTEHHVAEGIPLLVKNRDQVRAGQALSDGLVNPSDVVAAAGIGQARKELVRSLKDIFTGAKKDTPRRHLEITARNMLNYVESEDNSVGHRPGSVFKISSMKELPGMNTIESPVTLAQGKYLARNYLHHTIGSKVGLQLAEDLKKANINKVMVTDRPPLFNPVVTSIDRVPLQQEDFLARMASSRVTDSMLRAAHEGQSSSINNTINPIPAYAWGTDFGKNTPYY